LCQASFERTKELIGWLPETALDEGLSRTIVWLEQQLSGRIGPDW
jgi:nucleoside-diphosphate-sugar epimerase